MSVATILEQLHRDGLKVRTDGDRVLLSPREKVTPDVLELVKANKLAILEELAAEIAREGRRQQAIDMLLSNQTRRFTAVAGDSAEGMVPVMVAVRTPVHGIITGELVIPADRWDLWLFLQFLRDQEGIEGSH